MSKGWMRVREAAHLMGVSQSTVRRRVDAEELRGRTGKSGRQEVFLPAKLRRELEAQQATPCPPGHRERGKSPDEMDAQAKAERSAKPKAKEDRPLSEAQQALAESNASPAPADDAEPEQTQADLLKRYERLAGGSLILAQQHSDAVTKQSAAAYEQLAHTRSQVRALRKVALAGWGCFAASLLIGGVLVIALGVGKAKAEAAASANQQQAQRAEHRARTMNTVLTGDIKPTDAQAQERAADDASERAEASGDDATFEPSAGATPATMPGTLSAPGRRTHGPTVQSVAVPSE